MNQDLPQVDVAAFTDAEQLRLTSGRVLAWHNAQPRGEVPALAECCAVADGGKAQAAQDDKSKLLGITDLIISRGYSAEGSMGAGTPPKDASGYPTAIAVVAGLVSSVCQPESGGPV